MKNILFSPHTSNIFNLIRPNPELGTLTFPILQGDVTPHAGVDLTTSRHSDFHDLAKRIALEAGEIPDLESKIAGKGDDVFFETVLLNPDFGEGVLVSAHEDPEKWFLEPGVIPDRSQQRCTSILTFEGPKGRRIHFISEDDGDFDGAFSASAGFWITKDGGKIGEILASALLTMDINSQGGIATDSYSFDFGPDVLRKVLKKPGASLAELGARLSEIIFVESGQYERGELGGDAALYTTPHPRPWAPQQPPMLSCRLVSPGSFFDPRVFPGTKKPVVRIGWHDDNESLPIEIVLNRPRTRQEPFMGLVPGLRSLLWEPVVKLVQDP